MFFLGGHLGGAIAYTSVTREGSHVQVGTFLHSDVRNVSTGETSTVFGGSVAKFPVSADCWRSLSMDFIFDLPSDCHGHTGVLVFVCRFSKMVWLVAVPSQCYGSSGGAVVHSSCVSSSWISGIICE